MPIKIDTRDLEKEILRALAREINQLLTSAANQIRPRLAELLIASIMESPEVTSLFGGKLQAELGLQEPKQAIGEIVRIWADSIIIDVRRPKIVSGDIVSGLDIYAIRADYADVLSSDVASYISPKSGSKISWLEWLLLEGDRSIVIGYVTGHGRRGRTGMGIVMKKSKESWRVPPEFAGTEDNNFVTRALDRIDKEIESILVKIFSNVS